jgi:hypothetical protein
LVVVSVTVVTEVVIVSVGVEVGAVVVGVAVVLDGVVGGGAGAVVVVGSVVVSPVGAGAGAGGSVVLGATAEVVAVLGVTAVVVTVGLSDVPAPVNFTTAYTRNASTAAVKTPSPTSATGRWNHGVGGGVGSVIGYRP